MGKVQLSISFPASFLAAGRRESVCFCAAKLAGHTGLFSFHRLLCGGSNHPLACSGAKSPLLLVFASVIIILVEGMQSWISSPLAHLCFVKGLTFKRAGSRRSGKELGPHWPPFFPQRHDGLGKQRVAHILKFKKESSKLVLRLCLLKDGFYTSEERMGLFALFQGTLLFSVLDLGRGT